VLEHGTGALNVDGCRIGYQDGEHVQTFWNSRGTATINAADGVGTTPTVGEDAYDPSKGRWPANVILSHTEACEPERPWGKEDVAAWDCDPSCPVRLLDEQSGEAGSPAKSGMQYASNARNDGLFGTSGDQTTYYGDSGGASRFVLNVAADTLCVLCNLPCVESAGTYSPPSDPQTSTAPVDAQDEPSPSLEGRERPSAEPASNAGRRSSTMPATAPAASVPPSADLLLADWIVQHARSAASLCDSCATATAQSAVLWLTGQIQASQAGPDSMLALRRLTLARSLALIAAGARQTGIIPTTAELITSCGFASHATDAGTPDLTGESVPTRFAYRSKASSAERNAGLEGFEEQPAGVTGMRAPEEGEKEVYEYPAPAGIGLWLRRERERAGLSVKAVAAHFPSVTGGLTGCVWNWESENNRPTVAQWWKLKEIIGFGGEHDEAMTTLTLVPREATTLEGGERVRSRNVHPTVKPIALMRWLVRLVTPPGGTVLDPFTGSGTTGIAASLEGFNFVGIEREEEYVRIAEARIKWWSEHPEGMEMDKALKADRERRAVADTGQLGFLD
jgi:hypothetical protein